MKTINLFIGAFLASKVIAADLDNISAPQLGAGSIMTIQEFRDSTVSAFKKALLQGRTSLVKTVPVQSTPSVCSSTCLTPMLLDTFQPEMALGIVSLFEALKSATGLKLDGNLLTKWAILTNLNARFKEFSKFTEEYNAKIGDSQPAFEAWVDSLNKEKGGDIALIFLYLKVRNWAIFDAQQKQKIDYLSDAAQQAEQSWDSE